MAPEVGVSKHTVYAWKAKYGGVDMSQAQERSSCGMRLVADLDLDKQGTAVGIRKRLDGRVH